MLSLAYIKISFQILALFILFNYTTTGMATMYDSLMSTDYWDGQENREVWSSVMVVMLIQKLGILCLSFGILTILRIFTNKQKIVRFEEVPSNEHQENESQKLNGNNKNNKIQLGLSSYQSQEYPSEFTISFQTQFVLGSLLFLSILLFSHLQSTVNIVFILILKCISCVVLYLIVDCSKGAEFSLGRIVPLMYFCGVIVFSTLVKIAFNQIQGFYSAQLGALLQEISIQDCFGLIGMICLDVSLYRKVWEVISDSQQPQQTKISDWLSTLFSLNKTFQVLFSATKYCLLFLFILTLIKGQLLECAQFIQSHHVLISIFIHLTLFHFLNQVILFYSMARFNIQVFLVLIITNGIWAKMMFFFTKTFDIHTVVFLLLLFFVIALVKQLVDKKVDEGQKSE